MKVKVVKKLENLYEACKHVVNTKSFVRIQDVHGALYMTNDKLDMPSEFDETYRYLKDTCFALQDGPWTLLDVFTASRFVSIYEALKPENQARMDTFPFMRQIDIMWKLG